MCYFRKFFFYRSQVGSEQFLYYVYLNSDFRKGLRDCIFTVCNLTFKNNYIVQKIVKRNVVAKLASCVL